MLLMSPILYCEILVFSRNALWYHSLDLVYGDLMLFGNMP